MPFSIALYSLSFWKQIEDWLKDIISPSITLSAIDKIFGQHSEFRIIDKLSYERKQ